MEGEEKTRVTQLVILVEFQGKLEVTDGFRRLINENAAPSLAREPEFQHSTRNAEASRTLSHGR
jgi:hypothetical protein